MSAIQSNSPYYQMPIQKSEKATLMYELKQLKPLLLSSQVTKILLASNPVNSWTLREDSSNIYCFFKESEGLKNIKEFHLTEPGKFVDLKDIKDKLNLVDKKRVWRPSVVDYSDLKSVEDFNILIDIIRQKDTHSDMNCYVCNHFFDMDEAILAIDKSEFVGKIALLVKHDESLHITPLLIERTKNSVGNFLTKVMISDSIGTENEGREGIRIYARDILKKAKVLLPQAKFYLPKKQRQFDLRNCFIFSLNDVIQFFKYKNFFVMIDEFNKKITPEDTIKVSHLPPENMKFMQSIVDLCLYAKENQNRRWETTKEIPIEKRFFKNLVCTDKDKIIFKNLNAEVRFKKYQNLIKQFVASHASEVVEDSSQKYDLFHLRKFLQV